MIETRNSSIVPTVSRLAVYNNSFWFAVTSLIWNRSPRSSFLYDPQCVTFPHEKSQSICVSVVAELFNGVRITRQGKQSLNLASAAECFLSTRSICFPFVKSCLKHSYFFADTFSLSASKAAKNALQTFWIQTGCRKRLNIFAFHSKWSRVVSGMEMCNAIFW